MTYPSSQTIFELTLNMMVIETFRDLFKKDLIEAGSIYARRALRNLNISLYLLVILKRGLKRREAWEMVDLILKEGMMFSLMVGVELMNEVVDVNEC